MGFGFNLFAFPILLLATVGIIIYFLVTKKSFVLKILGALWILTIIVFILNTVFAHYRNPISLTRQDIIGEYRIDTMLFPGTNARWQYDHYRFFITEKDSIEFFTYKDKEIPYQYYKHKISYSKGPPDLWSILADTTHHIITDKPTLYRGHNKFYYVFHSKKFKNMFFRKIEK